MKRFALFAGDHYYPDGGWLDFVDSFDTAEEALKFVVEHQQTSKPHMRWDWWSAIDLTTGDEAFDEASSKDLAKARWVE